MNTTSELTLIASNSGIDPSAQAQLLNQFEPTLMTVKKEIENISLITEPKEARALRLKLKDLRVGTEKRRKELKELFRGSKAGLVFVTAFETRRAMQSFLASFRGRRLSAAFQLRPHFLWRRGALARG